MPAVDTITTRELCQRSGCTYRQADYWARTGLLPGTVPARGSGTRRGYSTVDVTVAQVLTALSSLGARGPAVHRAARSIAAAVELGLTDEAELLYVDDRGGVTFTAPSGDGWTVSLTDR